MSSRVLVLGSTGAIGKHLVSHFESHGNEVDGASRSEDSDFLVDPESESFRRVVESMPRYGSIVFAQGRNASDSVSSFDVGLQRGVFEANVVYLGRVLAELLAADRLVDGARICVVSSTWADLARQDRLSYSTSKAAVGGFVRACSVDLADRGMLVNAVLPGPLETPMTRTMLTEEQLEVLVSATPHGRLVSLGTLSSLVAWLVGPSNNDVTGECIHIDLGLSHARLV